MPVHSATARLSDILEAIENIGNLMGDVTLKQYETDWQKTLDGRAGNCNHSGSEPPSPGRVEAASS
jgi:hypothetical protein